MIKNLPEKKIILGLNRRGCHGIPEVSLNQLYDFIVLITFFSSGQLTHRRAPSQKRRPPSFHRRSNPRYDHFERPSPIDSPYITVC